MAGDELRVCEQEQKLARLVSISSIFLFTSQRFNGVAMVRLEHLNLAQW